MGTEGVGCVGQITTNCNVGKLSMANCDLKHEELNSFMKHSDGAKVRNFYLCLACVWFHAGYDYYGLVHQVTKVILSVSLHRVHGRGEYVLGYYFCLHSVCIVSLFRPHIRKIVPL